MSVQKKNVYLYSFIVLGALSTLVFSLYEPKFPKTHEDKTDNSSYATNTSETVRDDSWEPSGVMLPVKVNLDVPYINEAPENIWTGSWKNACEEAVIAMVDKYYQGIKSVSVAEAKLYMQVLFDSQKRTYGSDANSDVERTSVLIKDHAAFNSVIKNNPTVEDIKKELAAGRPVIGFHRGFDLQNKNIPFLPTGSSYHTTVVIGYDEEKKQFITNDPGDTEEGSGHRYDYDVFMNSLHDYNYSTGLANGPSRVLFTSRASTAVK